MVFNDLLVRSNGDTILAGWFNDIRTALITAFGGTSYTMNYYVNKTLLDVQAAGTYTVTRTAGSTGLTVQILNLELSVLEL